MKILSRSLLATAALSAVLAPSLLADLPGAKARPVGVGGVGATGFDGNPTQYEPNAFGAGSGMWITPTEVNGFVSAKLFDAKGHQRYAMRATLVYYIPAGDSTDQIGGIFGELLAPDAVGAKRKVADIRGTWVQHADGSGNFAAAVVVRQGDGSERTIGQMGGELMAPAWIPGPDLEPFHPAPRARLTMNWSISE